MAVEKAGDHRPAAQVDRLGAGASQRRDLGVPSHNQNAAILDRYR